jgi:hypothetical protein
MIPPRFILTFGCFICLLIACAAPPAVEPAMDPTLPKVQENDPSTLPPSNTPIQLPPTWTPTASATLKPATETPVPITISPTSAPLQALETLTPMPAEIVTPVNVDQNWSGWKWIESTNAKVRVPQSYEEFNFGEGMGELMLALMEGLMEGFDETFEGMEDLSGEDLQIEPTEMGFTAEELEGAFDFDFLIAFDEDFITSVVLASEPSSLSLEFAMEQSLQQIEGDFRVLSRQVIEGAPYEMGRFIIEVHDPYLDKDGRQLLYIILHEGQAYSLGYQTLKSNFEELLPTFEKSASSFTIK